MIEVEQLTKNFGARLILDKLNLTVEKGEFVAIIGPNGAGKTSLLRILASLSRPTSGLVKIANCILPSQAIAARHCLGFVSHQPLLYGDLSAEENMRFFSQLYALNQPEERIASVLAMVELTSRRHDLVRTYSRGMQQRLAIARAILHDPPLLLLDEPHTGLDQDACEMLDNLLSHQAVCRRTIIMTTHDLGRAAHLAERFEVLTQGTITASCRNGDLPENDLYKFYRAAINR